MFMQKLDPQAPESEIQQSRGFAATRQKILQLQENWDDFYGQLSQMETPYAEEFKQHNQNFSQAVDNILAALATPTLTLATTGTTSSGKSTLVNLLCGADIMPRMAGEMSAGIVTIKHSSHGKRLLKIEKTAGAAWECGEWKDLSDYDIRTRLTKTMDAFNQAKKKSELPSPVIELHYPIACFFPNAGLLELSDLPAHTQFQIMDLPGKRNQDDKINSAVIQNCRRALSIVTYNMEETDEKLRQSLMEEVLEQVKLMGGSPARMLFALNRIDVFRKDPDWEKREQDATKQTIDEIKKILGERLPEHRNVLGNLSYSKLSSLPALLAWQVKADLKNRMDIADQLDDHFNFMLSDEVKDDLPRSVKRWDDKHFSIVQETIWESSYAKDFFPVLEKHIQKNFSKLIIAPLLVEFEGVVSEIIDKASRICAIGIASANKQLREVSLKLDDDYRNISGKLNDYYNDLVSLPMFIANNPNGITVLQKENLLSVFPKASIYMDEHIMNEILPGFLLAMAEPIQWPGGVSEGATQSLKLGRINFTGTKAELLSLQHENRLKVICNNLIGQGYDSGLANKGKKIEAAWDGEKEDLNKLVTAIKNYSSELSLLMQDVYEQRIERENVRVQGLVEEIVKVFLEKLNDFVGSLDSKIKVRFRDVIVDKIKLEPPKAFSFHLDVDSETQIERNPWLLWLSTREVKYAEIPSADKLYAMIVSYLKSIRNQAEKPLQDAIFKYYAEIEKKARDYMDSIMSDVNKKFDIAYSDNDSKYAEQKEIWDGLDELAGNLSSAIKNITIYKA